MVRRRWNRWRRSLDENHYFITSADVGSIKIITFAFTTSSKFRLTKPLTFALDEFLGLHNAVFLKLSTSPAQREQLLCNRRSHWRYRNLFFATRNVIESTKNIVVALLYAFASRLTKTLSFPLAEFFNQCKIITLKFLM